MSIYSKLGLSLILGTVNVFSETPSLSRDVTSLPSSCKGLSDGQHYLKLMEGDDYPIILAQCSNEYILIDYSLDSDWSYYFTSFLKWHYDIAGPSQSDHYNWAEWYLPDDSNTNYLISPSCDVCDESAQSDYLNTQGLQSGYYMNANLFGCFVYPRGMPACDFDINTYECHACYTENFSKMYTVDWDDDDMTDFGACMTWIRGAYDEVDRTFDECTDETENGYKPTIGLKGEFCVCSQGSTTQYIDVNEEMINAKIDSLTNQKQLQLEETEKQTKTESLTADSNSFELYAKDFEKGTLRIKVPGTYVLMEDIVFDWNAGSKDDPNAYGAWFPNENDENYPGYGDTREQYFMGFFAGITIECNNVVLDLNGHEIKQSKEFFYQQGFFSAIEVESQPFIPGQGVGFFGSDPFFPENVIIKNGNIGRTSHHCIHGNYNKNLLIENINCYDFSTHGIQLNGFDGVTLRNVDIGPANTEQYLASEYTHYRFLLDRLRKIAENNPTGTIQFDGREAVTMGDIVEELELKMTLAFKYVMYGESYSEGDELYDDFIDAKSIFVSEHGYGYGASQYGLFLSYPGANVLSFHLNHQTSNDVTIENVNIHDLHHKTKEYVGLRTTLRLFVNSFNAPLHVKYLLGDAKWQKLSDDGPSAKIDSDFKYVGNILTDATLAMTELNDDWGLNQILFAKSDELTAWAKGEIDATFNGAGAQILSSVDGMIHSVKGTFGLRIDGVNDVKIDGLNVYNIYEDGLMGSGVSGRCTQCAFESRSPYHVGYSGNWAHGISIDYASPLVMKDVKVSNVESQTGRANGITLWPGVDAEFQGKIEVENLAAGVSIDSDNLKYWEKRYANPQACGIQVYEEDWGYSESDDDNDVSSVKYDDDVDIRVSCVSGGNGCWEEEKYTQHGNVYTCDGDEDDGLAKFTKKSTSVLSASSASSSTKKVKSSTQPKGTKSQSSELNLYWLWVIVAIVGLCGVAWKLQYNKEVSKLVDSEESAKTTKIATNTERTPLIKL